MLETLADNSLFAEDTYPDWVPQVLPNVWLGVSVESGSYTKRINTLRKVPAAVRFISFEPLIGRVGKVNLDGIHWAIIGGESGPGARPMELEWAREIVEQCKAQGVACFVKQLGGHPKKRADVAQFPSELQLREYPDLGTKKTETGRAIVDESEHQHHSGNQKDC